MYQYMSRAKKVTMAAIAIIAIVAGVVLLTGCPPTTEKKKNAAKTNVPGNIDSATLIKHLAYLSSAVMEGRVLKIWEGSRFNAFDSSAIGW